MVKLGFSVDNHFDVNHIASPAAVTRIAAYLVAHHYQVYVNAGDSFNDFALTQHFYQALQQAVGDAVVIRYLAGNHDLVKNVSYQTAQSAGSPLYLHEKTYPVPHTNTVIIGNNGWYDYSLAPAALRAQGADFAQWKRAYWIDAAIDQPVADEARMQRVLASSRRALAEAAGKRVIYVTHFVPTARLMVYSPAHPRWQMATALMGSRHLGALLERAEVADVVFGHLHRRDPALQVGATTYHHQPMGYGLRRLNEWRSDDWFAEWAATLVTLEA
ncbi:metallophosphoesterase [Lacticaseibacillus jixianensis]|uniref:Metallophosphoesterase n=1 Tax=Lacticaseibacillus jixianensis TaxID=2486012 RepID=A0ABW4BAK3_9LACO|nr:metallophosphoesterase [Lacticaseibacillus jixianensis]